MLLNKKKCHAAALLGTTGQHALIPKRQLHPTLTPFCRGSRHQLNLQSTNNPSPATKQDNRGELNQPSPSECTEGSQQVPVHPVSMVTFRECRFSVGQPAYGHPSDVIITTWFTSDTCCLPPAPGITPKGSQQQPGESALVPSGPSKPSGEGSAEPNQPDGGPGWWLRNRLQGPINWAAGLSEGNMHQ
eukprot:34947-Pelagomonas_calceolata.AAC.1